MRKRWKPFAPTLAIVVTAAAAWLVWAEHQRRSVNAAALSYVNGLCERQGIVPEPYASTYGQIRERIARGELSTREDIRLDDHGPLGQRYIPLATVDARLKDRVALLRIDVLVKGEKALELHEPVARLSAGPLGLLQAPVREQSCFTPRAERVLDTL